VVKGDPGAGARGVGSSARCRVLTRSLSAPGRGAAHPQIAVAGDTFALVWEENDDHRTIRLQTVDAKAQPLGPSVQIADLVKGGAAPSVVADGDGFAVLWTEEHPASSVISFRRVDAHGRPRGDVVAAVNAPSARMLAATNLAAGFVALWWNWEGLPHTLAASFLDGAGRPRGRPLPVSRAPSADPTVDAAPARVVGAADDAQVALAWEEMVDGVEHVFAGTLADGRSQQRVDLGPGETPELAYGRVVFERPSEHAIFSAGLDGTGLSRITDGHTPAAARHDRSTALCFIRDTGGENGQTDELWCGELDGGGRLNGAQRIAVAPEGVLALQIAAGKRTGVVYEKQERDDTAIAFATLVCAPTVAINN
jgi:hypothetical protein